MSGTEGVEVVREGTDSPAAPEQVSGAETLPPSGGRAEGGPSEHDASEKHPDPAITATDSPAGEPKTGISPEAVKEKSEQHAAEPHVVDHLVLVQHGSHGREHDMRAVVRAFLSLPDARRYHLFHTNVNNFLWSDAGVAKCTARILAVFIPLLLRLADARPAGSAPLRVSLIGHSFGGVLAREVAAQLVAHPDVGARGVDFAVFVSFASPHLGVYDLHPVLAPGARLIGAVWSQTYCDIIGPACHVATEMVAPAHLAALARFRRRVLYANERDHLVGFPSASLCFAALPAAAAAAIPDPDAFPHVGAPLDPADELRDAAVVGSAAALAAAAAPAAVVAARAALVGACAWEVRPVRIREWAAVPHNAIVAKGLLAPGRFADVPRHAALAVAAVDAAASAGVAAPRAVASPAPPPPLAGPEEREKREESSAAAVAESAAATK